MSAVTTCGEVHRHYYVGVRACACVYVCISQFTLSPASQCLQAHQGRLRVVSVGTSGVYGVNKDGETFYHTGVPNGPDSGDS